MLADPPGSALYEYIRNGVLKATGAGSITEGIGIGRVTANMQGAPVDDAVHIEDAETVACVYRLLREEGLFVGSTSGINVAAAMRVARQLGPGPRHRHRAVRHRCEVPHAAVQSRMAGAKGLLAAALGDADGEPAPRHCGRTDARSRWPVPSLLKGTATLPFRRPLERYADSSECGDAAVSCLTCRHRQASRGMTRGARRRARSRCGPGRRWTRPPWPWQSVPAARRRFVPRRAAGSFPSMPSLQINEPPRRAPYLADRQVRRR